MIDTLWPAGSERATVIETLACESRLRRPHFIPQTLTIRRSSWPVVAFRVCKGTANRLSVHPRTQRVLAAQPFSDAKPETGRSPGYLEFMKPVSHCMVLTDSGDSGRNHSSASVPDIAEQQPKGPLP